MNNELFDKMMKDHLANVKVTTSAASKKAFGAKLFWQNLITFHKAKLMLGLLVIGGGVYTGINMVNGPNLTERLREINLEKINRIESFVAENMSTSDLTINDVNADTSSLVYSNNVGVDDESNDDYDLKSDNYKEQFKGKENFKSNDSKIFSTLTSKDESAKDNLKLENEKVNNSEGKDWDINFEEKEEIKSKQAKDQNKTLNSSVVIKDIKPNEGLFIAESILPNSLDAQSILEPSKVEEVKMKNIKTRSSSVSFDVFANLGAQVDIDNEILNNTYSDYYWDFYKEKDALKVNNLGGVNAEYAYGSKHLKFKAGIGVGISEVLDAKATYIHGEITEQAWLDFFGVDELSWIETRGEDTCSPCFYTQNTPELQIELEQDYNRYKYLNIPFKVGGVVDFKYASLDGMVGGNLNILTNARGLQMSEYSGNDQDIYFWNEMQLTTMGRNNDMLKTSFLSYFGEVNLRVRVAPKFDVLLGYQESRSAGNITKDSYLVNKNMRTSTFKVGLTFHPFRAPLKP